MILQVENIQKSFGSKKILNDISFSIDAGECLGIVGRSGCGKSTLIKIIARFIPPDFGKIFLDGTDITNSKNLRAVYDKMQMIFQNPEDSFNPRQTLGWSISEPMKNHGFDRKSISERVSELLETVGLDSSYSERFPHEVSGGECQRAAIARAITLKPKILLCDEITSALDVTVQAKIIDLIRKLIDEQKIACLFITHDLALLPKISDRIIVMHAGSIVDSGKTRDVIENPKSKFTRELMSTDFFSQN